MPIYEYECQTCHHRFEAKQKFSDPPLTACDRCGQPVRKLISAPAIMFKGTGWYITDYSNKLKPESAGDSAEKSDKSNDSKLAEKSETTKDQKSEKPAQQADSSGTSSGSAAPATSDKSPKQTSQAATTPS